MQGQSCGIVIAATEFTGYKLKSRMACLAAVVGWALRRRETMVKATKASNRDSFRNAEPSEHPGQNIGRERTETDTGMENAVLTALEVRRPTDGDPSIDTYFAPRSGK